MFRRRHKVISGRIDDNGFVLEDFFLFLFGIGIGIGIGMALFFRGLRCHLACGDRWD